MSITEPTTGVSPTEAAEGAVAATDAVTATEAAVESPYEELARAALVGVAPAESVGDLKAVTTIADSVDDLAFAASLPGYVGWRWTVSVAHLVDTDPSVLEVELLPGDGSLLAPPWVPWADRLAEYRRTHPDEVPIDDADDADVADDDDLDDDAIDDEDDDSDVADDIDGVDLEVVDLDGVDFEDAVESEDDDDDTHDDEVDESERTP